MTIPCARTAVRGALLALLAAAPAARAAVEEVRVTEVSTDAVVIERLSGERWRLGLGQETHPDQRNFPDRTVLLWTPSAALSTEARLLAPDIDFVCAVTRLDSLGPAKSSRLEAVEPVEGLRAMRQALELIGYDCGPPSETPWTLEAGQAFLRFRESRRLDASTHGIRRAVTSLALDVMKGRQTTGTGLRLARIISDYLDPLVAWLSRPGAAGARCAAATWIRQVADDGSLVTLGDATHWQPLAEARAVVMRWQASDDVTVCSRRLVNWRTGEMARAVQL